MLSPFRYAIGLESTYKILKFNINEENDGCELHHNASRIQGLTIKRGDGSLIPYLQDISFLKCIGAGEARPNSALEQYDKVQR